ncbi:hypothetical protein GX50_09031, partial [[Emmonsia] crescens]
MVLTTPIILGDVLNTLTQANWQLGVIARDEYHLEKSHGSKTTLSFRDIRQLNHDWKPKNITDLPPKPCVWIMSGTPYDRGPIDIAYWMRILEEASWNSHSNLTHARRDSFWDLSTSTSRVISRCKEDLTPEDASTLQVLATKFGAIIKAIMIQRSSSYSWFGRDIVNLPIHHHCDIGITLGEWETKAVEKHESNALEETQRRFRANLQKWELGNKNDPKPKLEPKKFFELSHLIRLAAIFPATLKYRYDDNHKSYNDNDSDDDSIDDGTADNNGDDGNDDNDSDSDSDSGSSSPAKAYGPIQKKRLEWKLTGKELMDPVFGWRPRGRNANAVNPSPYSPYLDELVKSS